MITNIQTRLGASIVPDKQLFLCRAAELGFARAAFVSAEPFSGWAAAAGILRAPPKLFENPKDIMPGAVSIAVLLYPYAPLLRAPGLPPLSGYYFGEHASYLARQRLNAEFPFMQSAPLPSKRAAERAFPGCRGANGLVGIGALGTRICIQLLVSDVFEPDEPMPEAAPCARCGLCEEACPAGAIKDGVLDANSCLRSFLSGGVMPNDVKAKLPTLLGCEICQSVCPRNAWIGAKQPSEAMRAAFAYETLLSPEASLAPARALAGSNVSAARLRSQAIVLAAREGGYAKQIAAFLDSDNDTVRDAAMWALKP